MTPVTPEPLSEQELDALRQRRTILVHDGIGPDSYSPRVPLTAAELDSLCDLAREALALRAERDRLATRSDEHLRAHTASFEALSHLSATLFDGEVDDYLALAEKVIERVRQAEAERDRLRGVVAAASDMFDAERRLAESQYANNPHSLGYGIIDAQRVRAKERLLARVKALDALGPGREAPAPSATGAGR